MGGPIPKFNDYHLWKAMYCLDKESPIGRKKLSQLLGIGEGSTRSVLSILQNKGFVSIRKSGISLTLDGKKAWKKMEMGIAPVDVGSLTIGAVNCAVLVPNAADKVKFGCEERDSAIMSGATGATTLVYSNGVLMFPGNDYPLDAKSDKTIRSTFDLEEGDVVIIGTANDMKTAEEGAVSAGLRLLGGFDKKPAEPQVITPIASPNELLAIAFMIHDLVGGLPVCAKGKDDLGVRIENGAVIDNAYTGAVLEEVLKFGTTIRRVATSGPYKGIRVIVTPLEVNNKVVAAIGVVDIRSMAGATNLIRQNEEDEL